MPVKLVEDVIIPKDRNRVPNREFKNQELTFAEESDVQQEPDDIGALEEVDVPSLSQQTKEQKLETIIPIPKEVIVHNPASFYD